MNARETVLREFCSAISTTIKHEWKHDFHHRVISSNFRVEVWASALFRVCPWRMENNSILFCRRNHQEKSPFYLDIDDDHFFPIHRKTFFISRSAMLCRYNWRRKKRQWRRIIQNSWLEILIDFQLLGSGAQKILLRMFIYFACREPGGELRNLPIKNFLEVIVRLQQRSSSAAAEWIKDS